MPAIVARSVVASRNSTPSENLTNTALSNSSLFSLSLQDRRLPMRCPLVRCLSNAAKVISGRPQFLISSVEKKTQKLPNFYLS